MTGLDAQVHLVVLAQRIQCRAARDQLAVVPLQVILGEVALEHPPSHPRRPHVGGRRRALAREPQMHGAHREQRLGTGPPAGASAEPGPAQPRRFTLAAVVGLIEAAGLRPGPAHGVRVFADLVPGMFADADPGAADALLALEQAASSHPAFHDIATQFHIVGYR